MLIKIFPILHIIVTYYYIECLEPKYSQRKINQAVLPPAYGVINKNYYELETMKIYSTPNPIHLPNPVHLPNPIHSAAERIAIQYAPLEMTDSNNHRHTHAPNRTEPPTTTECIQKKPQELEEKDYLQPDRSSVDMIDRQQKARSFFSGHGIAIQSSSSVGAHGQYDLYRTYHNHVDQSKLRNAVYTSFQNPGHGTPEEELLPDGRTVLYLPGSGHVMPLQEKKYIRKVVPFVITKPFFQGAFARSQGALHKPSGQNKLRKSPTEKSAQAMQPMSALSPGLHLNLARVYGIAHANDQRHIDVPHSREKPPIMNKKSVEKKKIILHQPSD